MRELRYLAGVTTLKLDREACVGCGQCEQVCPQGVYVLEDRKAVLADQDGCMECGACAVNCPSGAITVSPGVGCAAAIVNSWLSKVYPAAAKNGKCC
jgi:ferredoxin